MPGDPSKNEGKRGRRTSDDRCNPGRSRTTEVRDPARPPGAGNPFHRLERRSREELSSRARELGIRGWANMSRNELIEAIRNY